MFTRKRIFQLVAIVLACLAVELFVFNLHTFESLTFPQVTPTKVTGATLQEDGSYLLGKDKTPVFEFDGQDVQNIYINTGSRNSTSLVVQMSDEGNSDEYTAISKNIWWQEYLRIHPAGGVKKLDVNVLGFGQKKITVAFNQQVPLSFKPVRFLTMLVIALLCWEMATSTLLAERRVTTRFGVVAGCLVGAAAFATMAFSQSIAFDQVQMHQYYDLAKSLAEGHVYLDEKPSPSLLAMDDPYDRFAREDQNVYYLWDHALYDGRYYVYFGVLPVILYHLPFYLLTHAEFPNWVGCGISAALFAVGGAFLVLQICRKWRPDASRWSFLAGFFALMVVSYGVYACCKPDLYALPIVTAMACGVWGLAFWVRAVTPEQVDARFGAAGSLLVALIILCRPQLILIGVFGIVLLARAFVAQRQRHPVRVLAVCLAPVVLVFAIAGAYNAARFGSPLDFGANYNLTTNDMTQRGFNFDRSLQGAFAYLVQPPNLTMEEPYLRATNVSAYYYGRVITEGTYGGIFALLPLSLLLVAALANPLRDQLRERGMLAYPVIGLACGVALALLDANGAGLLMRYYMDFGFVLGIGTAFVAVALQGRGQRNLYVALFGASCVTTALVLRVMGVA